MKLEFTVEWEDLGEDCYLEVELEGEPHWENDSFDYAGTHATHGQSGTHHLPSYTILDSDVEWDKTLYTSEQNIIIQNWVNTHTSLIEERFCNKLEEDSEPGF